jgi:hypothetical protein
MTWSRSCYQLTWPREERGTCTRPNSCFYGYLGVIHVHVALCWAFAKFSKLVNKTICKYYYYECDNSRCDDIHVCALNHHVLPGMTPAACSTIIKKYEIIDSLYCFYTITMATILCFSTWLISATCTCTNVQLQYWSKQASLDPEQYMYAYTFMLEILVYQNFYP